MDRTPEKPKTVLTIEIDQYENGQYEASVGGLGYDGSPAVIAAIKDALKVLFDALRAAQTTTTT